LQRRSCREIRPLGVFLQRHFITRVNSSHLNDKEYSGAVSYTQDFPWQRTLTVKVIQSPWLRRYCLVNITQQVVEKDTNNSWIIRQSIKGKISLNYSQT
jgi:hypothetical protein